ncbi:leucyl aminopeptidase [Actinomadura sp. 9N407]|uniref:leucyl aminopeptidase n=1 Tax=Actinomadura sp. 9N407 TaxID=3375154 RepID=UPI0037900289
MPKTLRELFVDQYRLCGLTSSETVGVIAELGRKTEYAEAAVAAARDLGAGALVLTASSLSSPMLPPYEADGREVAALLAAAAECDLVIDVTVGGLIHSDVRTRITGAGKRMLFVAEPADVLERLMGDEGLRRTVEAGGRLLKAGGTLRVTSAAGTDLTADISGADLPITHQWGYVDEPGRWDHWPSGFVACFPRDLSAEGTIVLQPGDVLIPWQRTVRDAVTLTIEKGFITGVQGPGNDAFVLRDYFEAWDDPEVWAVSHMGWGVHPVARWSALEVYEPRSLYGQELRSTAGNFMWSTGSNRFANRETPAHLDIPMRGCTVEIDGVAVVRDGVLTGQGE